MYIHIKGREEEIPGGCQKRREKEGEGGKEASKKRAQGKEKGGKRQRKAAEGPAGGGEGKAGVCLP